MSDRLEKFKALEEVRFFNSGNAKIPYSIRERYRHGVQSPADPTHSIKCQIISSEMG